MRKAMPLKDFIAQLQALENANPGIDCVLNDCEWGAHAPVAAVLPVYKTPDEYECLEVAYPEEIQTERNNVEKYTNEDPVAVYESFGEDADQTLEEYKKLREYLRVESKKRLDLLETSVPMVVIKIR